jgi:mRNA-degrading endonuclease toxin of MazEF toxin-antitoxin module
VTRGSIHWVNLTDADPPEMSKTRPAIIVSNSEQNAVLDTVVVVPLSTRPPAIWPLRIELAAGGKRKKSFAVVPALRQIDKRRLVGSLGRAPDAFLLELTRAVTVYLGE